MKREELMRRDLAILVLTIMIMLPLLIPTLFYAAINRQDPFIVMLEILYNIAAGEK